MNEKVKSTVVSVLLIVIIISGLAIAVELFNDYNPPFILVISSFNFVLFCQITSFIIPMALLLILRIQRVEIETRRQIGRSVSLIAIFLLIVTEILILALVDFTMEIPNAWIVINYIMPSIAVQLASYIVICIILRAKKET